MRFCTNFSLQHECAPSLVLARSSPAICFAWAVKFPSLSAWLLHFHRRCNPVFVPPQSAPASVSEALAHCCLQKTLSLCLCVCSKFTLSREHLSTALLCKAPVPHYGEWLRFLLCMALQLSVKVSPILELCFLWPAASVLLLQPDDQCHVPDPSP